jgi:uncharacterized protein YndB with AHSA1/START domain
MVSRVIAAPVDVVWRIFVDPCRRAEWVSDVASVTMLAAAEGELSWRETYHSRRTGAPAVADLHLRVLEPGRRCVVGLAGPVAGRPSAQLRRVYAFTSVAIGAHRGGTVVTVVDDRPAALADRLLDLVAGGFVARTVEGALRTELDALARACTTRVITAAA